MDIFLPIQKLADFVTYNLLNIPQNSYLGNSINFWIYDVIKISLLLVVINYLMAISRYYFPVELVKDFLTKKRLYGLQYLLAAILGAVTPFCSCSSIPLFIGFLSAGIPLGVTFSFLISSPLVNESSLILFPSVFGIKTTILYNLLGILISVLGGMLIQHLKLEKYLKTDLLGATTKNIKNNQKHKLPFKKAFRLWTREMLNISKSVLPFVILGVTIGAFIHGYFPEDLITSKLSSNSLLSVPIAVILGIPLYANSVSIIPIMEALINKGVPLGTALAFMTATVTLSLPEAIMLNKVIKWQLLFTFFGITIAGIILIGLLFNL